MSFKEGGIIDDGRQQSGECPEQQGGEELSDYRVLSRTETKRSEPEAQQHKADLRGIARRDDSPHVQILHGLGDVELIHGGDDDGRRREEEEQEEEDAVDDEAADPPGDPAQ